MRRASIGGGRLATKKRNSVSIYDVAKDAGVSIATVSRALNNAPKVRSEIVQRVSASAEKLGYLPAKAAQNLSSKRTHMLAAVIPSLDYAIYARKIEAFRVEAARRGYGLLIGTSNWDLDTEYRQCMDMIRSGAEGIMLEGARHLPALYEQFDRHDVKYVNTSVYNPDGEYPTIGFRNDEISARATRHLLDLGHRNIAVIAGDARVNDRIAGRIQGVTQALAPFDGLPASHVVQCRYRIADARDAFRHLMSLKPRPTGVICANDVLALGAFLEAQHAGIHIPDDISIIGFDDLDWAAHLKPGLTTFYVPTAEIGTRSAEYLTAMIEGASALDHAELDVPLILRGSTGPYPPNLKAARTEESRNESRDSK
jgi:LacI family transcriptional regulator